MRVRTIVLATVLFSVPLSGHAATIAPPPAAAPAVDVVKFVVNYENHTTDSTALLRGKSDKPTQLETLLFTRDFLTAWYAIKARETANPDAVFTPNGSPGIDNVTNGETDYIVGDPTDGQGSRSIAFKDMSDALNGTMIAMTYRTSGAHSSLFFLKQEDGRFKIDDIALAPFSNNNFSPKVLHQAGTSEGVRKDIVKALNNFESLKK